MATRAELEALLAERDREPVTVPWVLAVPIMCTGVLLTVALLFTAAQRNAGPSGSWSPWWLAVPGVIAWMFAHTEAGSYFPAIMYGHGPRIAARLLAAGGGAAATSWLVWTGHVGPAVTWTHLLLGTLTVTLAWWALLWVAERRVREPAPVVTTSTGEAVDHAMPWAKLLDRATGGSVTLTAVDYHRAGARLTVEPARFTDDDGVEHDVDVTFDGFARTAETFQTLAASEFRRRTSGQRLPNNCARPEPGRDDAEFVLHVTMRDVFGESSVFVPATAARDIAAPSDLGEYEDATRIMVSLLSGHAKIVGATGSGKSVLVNNWIARITECGNALVWICATDKLIPLIFPWLRSWFAGTAVAPCLDYVAGLHVDRVLGMLADAYRLCCERNARLTDESKMTATSDEPAVFVVLEEMSHTMEFKDTIQTHDGMECDASTLLMLIARAGRSANVRIVLISQTALNSSSGDCAAEIIRNLQIRMCLRTMESHDGYRTIPALNNVDTTTIPLHTMIVQPSIEATRAMPGKAPMLDGTATIDDIARRNAGWRPRGVEAESRLGERYARRWDPDRHPELARAVQKHGLAWRVPNVAATPPPATMPPAASIPTWEHPGSGAVPIPPWNIIEGGVDNHPGGGNAMDMTWTARDDAALADLLDGPDDDVQRGAFRLPNGDKELDELRRLAREIADSYAAPDDDPGVEPNPLPEPLASVIAWLEREEYHGTIAGFYLTETIAREIGHPDHNRLGRELSRITGTRTRNAYVHEDPRKRKGYDVSTLREAATRLRFGL